MSDEKSEEYFKLWKTSFDTATDIARAYIDTNIIQKNFNNDFVKFLEQNKHDFFTRWIPRKTCCCCLASTFSRQFEQFDNKIFNQIYSVDYTVSCKSPKQKNGVTKCVCQIVTKQDVSLECLDIGALACIMKQYGKVDVIPLGYINKLRELRNELCHTNKTDAFENKQLEDKWVTIETAMNGLLDEISLSPYLRKLFTRQIEDIKNRKNKTTSMIKSLSSIGEKVDSRLSSVEKEIKTLKRSIGQLQRKPSNVFSVNAKIRAKKTLKKTSSRKDNKSLLAIVNSKSIDETKVIQNLSEEISRPKTDEECSQSFNITNIERQCIRFNLEASPELFANTDLLKNAVDDFINRLLITGEVDINTPGTIEIEFIVNSQLSEEEMSIVQSVFDQDINCSDDTEYTVDPNDGQLPEVKAFTNAQQTEKKHLLSDSSKSEDEFTTIQPLKREFDSVGEKKPSLRRKRFKQAKGKQKTISKTNEDNVKRSQSDVDPDIVIERESQTFSLYFDDIPEHLGRFVEMSEAESSKTVWVQWSFDCPSHWKISDLVEEMNKKLVNFKGWFRPVLIFQDKETGRLILQCNTQCQLFSSRQQFELEVKNFIELIEDKCQLQTYSQTHGDKHEDVGISLSVIMPPDGYLLEDDPKNLTSETEKEPLHAKRTDLDYALIKLGVKQCLEMKYKEYTSKLSSYCGDSGLDDLKNKFYRDLRDTARKRKNLIQPTKLIKCVKSHIPVAVAEFPELDLFDDDRYSIRCNYCSNNNVKCWCRDCKRLYCNDCITTCHTDFLHNLEFKRRVFVTCPALTLIKTCDINPGKFGTLLSLKSLKDKLIMLTEYNQQYELLLWKDTVLDSKSVDGKYDYSANSIVVIDSHTFAYQTEVCITIFTINNDSIINELSRIPTDAAGRYFAHVNGILYIGFDSGIVKMTLEGKKVGEIKCENVTNIYANGTQIYFTTAVKGQYVNVIDTTTGDIMWSLEDFPTCPKQMEFTSNGNIVFLKETKIWYTPDEGKCCHILYCGEGILIYRGIQTFCVHNDEIYLAIENNITTIIYKFNEEMLTQLRSQPSTSAGTSFQKSLPDPGMSAPVTPDVPVLGGSIDQTPTAEEQGGLVRPETETSDDPDFSNSVSDFPIDLSSSPINPMTASNQHSLQQESDTTSPVRESYFPFEQLQTFGPGEDPYHQRFPELTHPYLQHREFQEYDPKREGPVNPTFEVPGPSNSLQIIPVDQYSSQISSMPVIGHQNLLQERNTFYSNPGPSQPSFLRPPFLPPGDDVITIDEDSSD